MNKVYFARFILKLFYIFKVNTKKVFFSSYEGASISCNPKYIYKELYKKYGDNLIYVWESNKDRNVLVGSDRVIYVKHNSISYIYHVMTSKIIISNTGITASFPLRKNQLSINTWHGAGCYKKVGIDYEENLEQYKKRRMIAEKNITYYLSGCKAWTKVFSQAVISDEKKFLPIGSPRVDYLINDASPSEKERIKKILNIHKNIVLYAPTYRGERDIPEDAVCPLDVEKLLTSLVKRFGGEWIFGYRCHYATASKFKNTPDSIDLSSYEDMQELLVAADVLISDYSSSIWDFSFTGNPCFLYCYDLDLYIEDRDFYIPIMDWHFPVSRNMNELCEQIII